MLTLSIIKADTGGFVGHSSVHPRMVDEARERVEREWGMSDRLGHIAWGAQGPVFLGEDIIHTRDYSDETAHIIDEEIARILDEQANRAAAEPARHRPQLDDLATALLDHESLEAAHIARILSATDRAPATGARGL